MDVDLGVDSLIFYCNVTTIAVCIFNKIPQLLTLHRTKNPVGVSETGVIVELIGYMIGLCYNVVQAYPLLSYLEYVFLVGQDIILILYIFYLMGTLDTVKFGAVGLFLTVFYGFTQGIPHPSTMHVLIKLVAPISASSKLIHLRAIWTTRNSESVSVLTWMIAAYTCATRIITTLLTSQDPALLTNYFTAFILNIIIVGSALYFKERSPKPVPEKSKESRRQD